jgi:hypothetical protein
MPHSMCAFESDSGAFLPSAYMPAKSFLIFSESQSARIQRLGCDSRYRILRLTLGTKNALGLKEIFDQRRQKNLEEICQTDRQTDRP